jgi:hypothetical protein
MRALIARVCVMALACLMMAGCAGMQRSKDHPAPTVQPDKGLVYFYRESSFKGAGIQYDIRDNGEVIGALQSGTYFYEYATPGQHTYSAKTEASSEVVLNVEAGKTYYVKGSITFGFIAGHPKLEIVSDEVAAQAALTKVDYATKSAPAQH